MDGHVATHEAALEEMIKVGAALGIFPKGADVESMSESSTKVFIMDVMGRHAGWIAAAGGLAAENAGDAPHLILFPERVFN